jgi:small neutral amino acid transporter SnatA (MarC family)
MKRSLFLRMLVVYLFIILMAFTLVGGIFFNTLRNQYLETQMKQMMKDAQEINDWKTDSYYLRISDYEFSARLMQKAENEDTVIWLVDNLGNIYEADPENKGNISDKVSAKSLERFFAEAQKGNSAWQVSNVDNVFKQAVISIAVPLTVKDPFLGDTIVGAIMVHKEVGDVPGISDVFRQVFFPLLISIIFASMLVFVLSRYIVRPIKAVSIAAC